MEDEKDFMLRGALQINAAADALAYTAKAPKVLAALQKIAEGSPPNADSDRTGQKPGYKILILATVRQEIIDGLNQQLRPDSDVPPEKRAAAEGLLEILTRADEHTSENEASA